MTRTEPRFNNPEPVPHGASEEPSRRPDVGDAGVAPWTRSATLGLALTLAATTWLLGAHWDAPFDVSYHGWNGACVALSARNYARFGFGALRFAMCLESGPPVPSPEIYLHHTPMIAWLGAASFAYFGEGSAAVARVAYAESFLAAALAFLFLRRVANCSAAVATFGAVLMVATPMFS